MKAKLVMVAFAAAPLLSALTAFGDGFVVGNEDRVCIYGDSITAGVGTQTYPRYVETYIRCVYPDWKYYKTSPGKNPTGPLTGVNKVLRGGDSCFSEDYHRCSARFLCDPARRDCVKVTFRVVVEQKIK